MSKLATAVLWISLLFIACNSPRPHPEAAPETPAALQENKSYEIGISKRGGHDLVEELYDELLKKDPELQRLEDMIAVLDEQKTDSLAAFRDYDNKVQSYYRSAGMHLGNINDSALRMEIKSLISNSESAYQNKISRHSRLIELIHAKDSSLADLHIVLKLVRTMSVMEKFQSDHLPSTTPAETVNRNFDNAIQKAKKLSGK